MEARLSPGGLGAIEIIEPKPLKYRYKTAPFAHQKKALNRIIKLNGRCMLAMEMGTGKTKVAIDWASICYRNYGLRRVLVVAPVSVLSVWKRQIRQHSPVPARIGLLSGPTTDKARLVRGMTKHPYEKGIDWVIVNYESLWRDVGRERLEDVIQKWQPDLVIADESHKIKHSTSKQSKSLSRLGDAVPMALALSGTPITKSPLDVFGQFRFLNSAVFGTRWGEFKTEYGVWGGLSGFQLKYVKNLPRLKKKVRANSYQVRKEQCLDLPPKLGDISDPSGPNIVPVELPDAIMTLYRDMAQKMIIEFEDEKLTASIILTKLLRLSQITSGHITNTEGVTRILHDYKVRAGTDLIKDMVEQEEKVVVFTRFRADYQRLAASLAAAKIDFSVLSGDVPASQREGLVSTFQSSRSKMVFVSQIASGSLGIELTAASHCLFYSWDYRWDHYVQASDRIHRQGQTRSCTYYHLVVPRTIDELSLGILMKKGNLAKYIIHDPHILAPSLT